MKRLFLLFAALSLFTTAATAQTIPCPVSQVRTEIVTTLPSPWWQTPQVGNLTGTKLQVIGGKTTLVCTYWAYGVNVSVMRLPPTGKRCTPTRTGFVCR
jgi:hypothetical protein